jgi:AcrR family transcriptional regulator
VSVVEGSQAGGADRRVGGGGRQLDSSRDAVILRAALDGLAEHGYDRLTMDEIAARAHAGKGALYRRWPSKAALVIDAVIAWREERAPLSVPDTGSLRGDVEAAIGLVPDFDDADRRQFGVFLGLVTAASRDPELAAAFEGNLLERPRRVLAEMVERAVERGEVARDRDLDLLPDMFLGLNMLRILRGESVDRAFVRRVFEEIVLPLMAVPAAVRPGRARERPSKD